MCRWKYHSWCEFTTWSKQKAAIEVIRKDTSSIQIVMEECWLCVAVSGEHNQGPYFYTSWRRMICETLLALVVFVSWSMRYWLTSFIKRLWPCQSLFKERGIAWNAGTDLNLDDFSWKASQTDYKLCMTVKDLGPPDSVLRVLCRYHQLRSSENGFAWARILSVRKCWIYVDNSIISGRLLEWLS